MDRNLERGVDYARDGIDALVQEIIRLEEEVDMLQKEIEDKDYKISDLEEEIETFPKQYLIKIPTEQPLQFPSMDLEEVAENYAVSKSCIGAFQDDHKRDFINGYNHAKQTLYSESDMIAIAEASFNYYKTNDFDDKELEDDWRKWLNKRLDKK